MMIARVMGSAVATIKHPAYRGRKVMVVQPLDQAGEKEQGTSFLAVDAVQAGAGDRVLVAREGNTAQQILDAKGKPIHSVILSIVDEVKLGK